MLFRTMNIENRDNLCWMVLKGTFFFKYSGNSIMIFRSNSIFKICALYFLPDLKKSSGSFPSTRAANLLINSFFSYTIYYPQSIGFCLFFFFFNQLESFLSVLYATLNSHCLWPFWIEKSLWVPWCMLALGTGQWQRTQRVANTAPTKACSACPDPCLAGVENHSGEVSTWFNSACSPEKGWSSSPLRDVFRVFQVDVVFRIYRTDSQWELPEWQLDLNLAWNPVSCFSLITW